MKFNKETRKVLWLRQNNPRLGSNSSTVKDLGTMVGDERNMRLWYDLTANNCRLHSQQCWEEGGHQFELDICMALVGLQVDYSIPYSMKSRYKDDRAKLFMVVPEDVTRGSGHTWQMGRFGLSIRKAFSTRCCREVVEAPSLEAFHNLAR